MAWQFRLDVNLTWRDTLTTVSSAQLWMGKKMLVNLPPFSVAIDAESCPDEVKKSKEFENKLIFTGIKVDESERERVRKRDGG